MSDLVGTIKDIQRSVGVEADGVFGTLSAAAVWKALESTSNIERPTSNVEVKKMPLLALHFDVGSSKFEV